MKRIPIIHYDDLFSIDKLKDVYYTIRRNTRHKEKILKFELFLASNLMHVQNILKSKNYQHGKYHIFLITSPKCRVIMSESMSDKIINHLVSKYVLFPLIEPRLIDTNVATRKDKGTNAAMFYLKKYIHSIKENCNKIYILKCDISKYFYSIDHELLKKKIHDIVEDIDIIRLMDTIIDSTDYDYINKEILYQIETYKTYIKKLPISDKEKNLKYKELNKIPFYNKGKGLPIGNMSSQIMAIFYLNELDHFIKEKLHIKYYIRYMDDFILIHADKKYLQYCLCEIQKKVASLKLALNHKTQIYEIHNGFPFLGYRFILKEKRLYTLMNSKAKKRIRKDMQKNGHNYKQRKEILMKYNSYLMEADSGDFQYYTVNKK